ncbi:MAG: formate dehydrogenase accessory sulfurtransferase FdhD [Myxococcota bacterium]
MQTRQVQRRRYTGAEVHEEQDLVAVEEPLEIRLRGRAVVVLLRTPGRDEDLALGFCITEGLLPPDVGEVDVRPCENTPAEAQGNVVEVFPPAGLQPDFSRHAQPRYSNSACGVCGTATLDNLLRNTPALQDARTATLDELRHAPDVLLSQQPAFRATGGLHAAGLIDDTGAMCCVREDVGRHNATDKTLGAWALERPGPVRPRVLVVSSRAGFEIVEKAHVARVPVVVCVGAPTSLAVETAQRAGLTLCAFAARGGISVYSHPQRVR